MTCEDLSDYLKIPENCIWKKIAEAEREKEEPSKLTSLLKCLTCNGTNTECKGYQVEINERDKYGNPKGLGKKYDRSKEK